MGYLFSSRFPLSFSGSFGLSYSRFTLRFDSRNRLRRLSVDSAYRFERFSLGLSLMFGQPLLNLRLSQGYLLGLC